MSEIATIGSYGTNFASLGAYGDEPIYTPSGNSIIFSGGSDDPDIAVMNSDGTAQATLVDVNNAWELDPAISANGSKIAFASDSTGRYKIYVANPDGTGVTPIATTGSGIIWERQPTLSPDGTKIAFTRYAYISGVGYQSHIYTINVNGTGQTRITSPSQGQAQSPQFSPDGSKIAFARPEANGWNIFLMNADGSDQRRVTSLVGSELAPTFSPNGSKLAFVFERPSDSELLQAYAPLLRYDILEGYRADSAATITDNYVAGSHTNRLTRGPVVLANSDLRLPPSVSGSSDQRRETPDPGTMGSRCSSTSKPAQPPATDIGEEYRDRSLAHRLEAVLRRVYLTALIRHCRSGSPPADPAPGHPRRPLSPAG